MGEREMAAFSSLHLLAGVSELVREGIFTLSSQEQDRETELPTIFCDKVLEMQGQEVMLVLEKSLCASDLNPSQSRLSIPILQTRAEFLRDEEIRTLHNRQGIPVSLIQPCLDICHGLQLKKRISGSGNISYAITKRWNSVAGSPRNGLHVGIAIQLWSFRVNGNLWFCLINRELGD